MRVLGTSVLVFESLVIFFATLVATDLSELDDVTVWSIGGAAALACLLLAGLLRFRWAYVAGSAMQVLVVAGGLVVPVMFLLGVVFAGLWFLALYLGRKVERAQGAGGDPAAPG